MIETETLTCLHICSLGGEDGHLIVDMRRFNSVTVDPEAHTAVVGAGGRLGNIALALYEQGKQAISHGTCPGSVEITGEIDRWEINVLTASQCWCIRSYPPRRLRSLLPPARPNPRRNDIRNRRPIQQ